MGGAETSRPGAGVGRRRDVVSVGSRRDEAWRPATAWPARSFSRRRRARPPSGRRSTACSAIRGARSRTASSRCPTPSTTRRPPACRAPASPRGTRSSASAGRSCRAIPCWCSAPAACRCWRCSWRARRARGSSSRRRATTSWPRLGAGRHRRHQLHPHAAVGRRGAVGHRRPRRRLRRGDRRRRDAGPILPVARARREGRAHRLPRRTARRHRAVSADDEGGQRARRVRRRSADVRGAAARRDRQPDRARRGSRVRIRRGRRRVCLSRGRRVSARW